MASQVPKKGVAKTQSCRVVTTKTAEQIRRGSQEISQMADFLLAGGFKAEADALMDAAGLCARAATDIERKIDAYRQAVNNLD